MGRIMWEGFVISQRLWIRGILMGRRDVWLNVWMVGIVLVLEM